VMERNEIPGIFFVVTDFVFDGRDPGGGRTDGQAPERAEFEAAVRSPWITIGNHTASHPIASRTRDEEFEAEIERSQARLREELGAAPKVFAWPRGRAEDVTQRAAGVLENHGIEAAFTMVPGRISGTESPYFLPRTGMSHVNDSIVFRVKLVGLLGPLVKIKNTLGA
jgi:peptidoglycan/xylan/chitin deacetylase (PgdA/CDA1 family)